MTLRNVMANKNGFTFIEIMVSLLILSLMLLGLDLAQLTALRNSNTSYYFAAAVSQLHLMQERLRVLNDADMSDQLQRWNQQNAKLLPHGHGIVDNKKVTVYWGEGKSTSCVTNQIGLSGCVTATNNAMDQSLLS